MKNFFILSTILLIFSVTFYSCTEEKTTIRNDEIVENVSLMEVDGVVTQDQKISVFNWVNKNLKNGVILGTNKSKVEFDFENLSLAYLDGNEEKAIVANQVGFDANNTQNYGIAFFEENDIILNAMVISTQSVNENLKRFEYFDLTGESLIIIEIDALNETINVIKDGEKTQVKGWGQDTADCIVDVYSNHGWISVWAFVQTAFIPATGAALAAACAIHNI